MLERCQFWPSRKFSFLLCLIIKMQLRISFVNLPLVSAEETDGFTVAVIWGNFQTNTRHQKSMAVGRVESMKQSWELMYLWWTGVTSRVYSCLLPSLPGISSRSISTTTKIKWLLKVMKCMTRWRDEWMNELIHKLSTWTRSEKIHFSKWLIIARYFSTNPNWVDHVHLIKCGHESQNNFEVHSNYSED